MRTYAILLTLAIVALATVQAKLPLYHYPKGGCCFGVYTCSNFQTKPTCKAVSRPFCPPNNPFFRKCRQNNLILLQAVYFTPFPKHKTMCCTVVNCPRILFSKCSYQQEKCGFPYGICTPRRFKRYRLQIVCPNKKGYVIYRYFPNCCLCRRCPGNFYTFPGK